MPRQSPTTGEIVVVDLLLAVPSPPPPPPLPRFPSPPTACVQSSFTFLSEAIYSRRSSPPPSPPDARARRQVSASVHGVVPDPSGHPLPLQPHQPRFWGSNEGPEWWGQQRRRRQQRDQVSDTPRLLCACCLLAFFRLDSCLDFYGCSSNAMVTVQKPLSYSGNWSPGTTRGSE